MNVEIKDGWSALNVMAALIHQRNVAAGWWTDPKTGADLRGSANPDRPFSSAKRDLLNLLMLAVTELAEAAEGVRKDCPDDKLPHRSMFEVELADALIRIFDMAGAHDLDLAGAVREKLAYNAARADHKPENRLKEGGKAF